MYRFEEFGLGVGANKICFPFESATEQFFRVGGLKKA